MNGKKLLLFQVMFCLLIAVQAQGDERQNQGSPFDWTGVFRLYRGSYTLSFKTAERSGCPSFVKLVIRQTAATGSDNIDEAEGKAVELFYSEPLTVPGGKGIILIPANILYALPLEMERSRTEYSFRIDTDGTYVISIEAGGIDFAGDGGFLTDSGRRWIKPIMEKRS